MACDSVAALIYIEVTHRCAPPGSNRRGVGDSQDRDRGPDAPRRLVRDGAVAHL
jgi:hypothetical protein